MAGWLWKPGKVSKGQQKRRWYELRGGVLRHYDGPAEGGGKARVKSALTVRGLVVEEAMAAARRHAFLLRRPDGGAL